MKQLPTTLTFLILIFLIAGVNAQVLERKAFKEATTIRLYVNDATESAALERFTEFINKTSWTVQSSSIPTEVNKGQRVDTLMTDTGSLFDFMMGEFRGQLIFYVDRDSSDNIYVGVSGYSSALSWGGSDKAQMRKGGQGANWTQRAMFKQVDKHLSDFSDVDSMMYSNE
ncbi:MAG: hypothetical protein WBG42_06515 [Cryomorphaceae bacterium]